jgi:hypothetical protein
MQTGLNVGNLMDHMDTIAEQHPDTPVITDTGEIIFTIAPETTTNDTHAHVAAMTLDATSHDPVSVDDLRSMFAYYNVATPRSKKATGACRTSTILLRPMDDHTRHITAVTHTDTEVVLTTAPND